MVDLLLECTLLVGKVHAKLTSLPEGAVLAEATGKNSARETLDYLAALNLRDLTPSDSVSAGRTVSNLLLPGSLLDVLADQLEMGPTRIRVALSSDLDEVPFEMAYIGRGNCRFLCLHPRAFVCRNAPTGAGRQTNRVRSLIVQSNPGSREYPPLAYADAEVFAVERAFASPECRGAVVRTLKHATPKSLKSELAECEWDIVHFCGHGDVMPSGGTLILEGAKDGHHEPMYADELGRLVTDARVQLVFLSACKSGSACAAISERLLASGVLAAVAMKSDIGDGTALLFARAFYGAIGLGHSLEEALQQGRLAVQGCGSDWASPVLLTGTPDFKLVAIDEPSRGNVRRPLTTFVGREKDVSNLAARLVPRRCVTLLGSGGIGKTRLSVEVALEIGPKFRHGAWQIALDSVEDPELVLGAIGNVFGISETATQSLENRLVDFLQDQEILLLLDNCEHLLGACRDAVNLLLGRCDRLAVLATSREALKAEGESVFSVPPLTYPKVVEDEELELSLEEAISGFEATKLFVQRAVAGDPDFKIEPADLTNLCRIVARLDGIPLAIEIASARTRTLTLGQIAKRLDEEFDLLDLGRPGTVPRHQTVRAAIDWSYNLLSPKSKVLLARLGAFAGPCSLEALENVASIAPLERGEILELVSGLVEKSLVLSQDGMGEKRFGMLETNRHYARERLEESDGAVEVHERLLDYMCDFANKALNRMMPGGEQLRWKEALELELDNLRSILDWAVASGRSSDKAGGLARDLFLYWFVHGGFEKARRLLERTLDRVPPDCPRLRIELMTLSGAAAVYGGDPAGLERIEWAHERALDEFPEIATRFVLPWLIDCAYMVGKDDLTMGLGEKLIQWAAEKGDPKYEGFVRLDLGNIEFGRGNPEAAREHYAKMLSAKTAAEDITGMSLAQCYLAYVASSTHDGNAAQLYAEGLKGLNSVSALQELAAFLLLASELFLPADPATAARVQGCASRIREEAGSRQDRFLRQWGEDVVARTREMLGDRYDFWLKEGVTLPVDYVVALFK